MDLVAWETAILAERVALASEGNQLALVAAVFSTGYPREAGHGYLALVAGAEAGTLIGDLPDWSEGDGLRASGPDWWNTLLAAGGDAGFAATWRLSVDDPIEYPYPNPNRMIMIADPTRPCLFRYGVGWSEGERCGARVEAWSEPFGEELSIHPVGIARSARSWTVAVADVETCPFVSGGRLPPPCGCLYGDQVDVPDPAPVTAGLRLYEVVPPPQEPVTAARLAWSYDRRDADETTVVALRPGEAGVARLALAEHDPGAAAETGWRAEIRTFDWEAGDEPANLLAISAGSLGVVGPIEVADFLVEEDHVVLAYYSGVAGPTRTAHLAAIPLDYAAEDGVVPNTSLGTCLRSLRLAGAPGSALLVGLCAEDVRDPSSPNRAFLWHGRSAEALLRAPGPTLVLDPPSSHFCQFLPAGVASGYYGIAVTECNLGVDPLLPNIDVCDITLRLFGCTGG
jgi:hypothetical protein